MANRRVFTSVLLGLLCLAQGSDALRAGDWPQWMHTADRAGNAEEEALKLPLGLESQIALDDAVTTSPAIVNDRAYVVDQMGTAYCIDLATGTLRWKAAPDGKAAFGSNTSSPCVVKGRVCYGTTAGRFHVLDAATGHVVKSLDVGASVMASPSAVGSRIYFQSALAIVYCVNLDGEIVWTWDHYKKYRPVLPDKLKNDHPRSYELPHYGGGDVAVSGKLLVTGIGWDHLCLEDLGDHARLKWCNRKALGRDMGVPMPSSISGGYVYTAWPGADGAGSLLRVSLDDGSFDRRRDQISGVWAVFGAPAVRDSLLAYGRHVRGVTLARFGEAGFRPRWSSYHWSDTEDYTPTFGSPVLTRDHCLFTTLDGRLIAVPLDARGDGIKRLKPAAHQFQTPHGSLISTTPAVANGRVVFGCDDGYLYVLSGNGRAKPRERHLDLQLPKSKLRAATGKSYDWPVPGGDQGNTRFVHDAKLRPPFHLRWVVRSFGIFHQPLSAAGEDIIFVSRAGTVACLEQSTARIRWRTRLPRQITQNQGALCADGRVYVARPLRTSNPAFASELWCFDQATGEILWQRAIGSGSRSISKTPPVLAGGTVAFASFRGDPPKPIVEGWDAKTGQPKWQVPLDVTPKNSRQFIRAPTGCVLDGVMFFSVGGMVDNNPRDRYPGETVAIDAESGRTLWRTREAFTTTYSALTARDGRLYVFPQAGQLSCLSAKDGSVIWKSEKRRNYYQHGPTLGPDFFAVKGYGGTTRRYSLADCQLQNVRLGAPDHTCSSALLTASQLSLVASVGGLYVRDFNTGELVWQSEMGFAPRVCANPAVSNGRIFINPQVNGMLYCFEPKALAP